jgi:hypothetical protein
VSRLPPDLPDEHVELLRVVADLTARELEPRAAQDEVGVLNYAANKRPGTRLLPFANFARPR